MTSNVAINTRANDDDDTDVVIRLHIEFVEEEMELHGANRPRDALLVEQLTHNPKLPSQVPTVHDVVPIPHTAVDKLPLTVADFS